MSKIIAPFFLLGLFFPLAALDPVTALDKYSNRIWTRKGGLPQDTVYAVTQDQNGYIWIGTDDGLVRFDGINFKIFNKRSTRAIRNNSITALFTSRDGTLWIGTFGGGVTVYKEGRFKNYNRDNGLSNNFIWAITEDREQDIWIGTTGGGLVRFKDNLFSAYGEKDGLANDIVKTLCEDSSGRLWVGTEKGLSMAQKTEFGLRFKTYGLEDGLADDVVMALFEDSKKNLWIGTGNGLNRKTGEEFFTYNQNEGLNNNVIHAIYEDREQNLWIATERGLNRMQGDKIESLTLLESLSDNSLLTIFGDREGNLWIGTSGKGVNMLHDSKFRFYTAAEGLSEDNIRTVYEDSRGQLWAGTNGGGLNRIFNGRVKIYTTANGLNSNFVNSVWENSPDSLVIGTGRGLNLFRDGGFSRLLPGKTNGVAAPSIVSLYEDREKILWIGTYGAGLYFYREENFYQISAGRMLANNFVISITEDKSGDIWVGTNDGLTRISKGAGTIEDLFAEKNYKSYSRSDGLSSDMIYDVYVDAGNVLWIGTNGGGLNRFEKGKFTVYNSAVGLFSDVVYRVLEDDSGGLWMSGNKGIFSVAKKDLDKFSKGEMPMLDCQYFQEDDGLVSSVCSGGFQPAGWKGRDGVLYFPTNRGIAAINPAKVKYNEVRPPVIIEEVLANGRPVDSRRETKLPAGTQRIEIAFTALSFTAPRKMSFSYRLSGFEERWHETRSRDRVVYVGLTPGDYKFKVIACNNDNTWNYKGASYSFSIKYRLYQKIWFQLLMLFLVFSFLYGYYRVRKSWMKSEKYRASTLETWQAQHHLQKLLTLMDEEKPYLDPEITVEKLSKMLGLSEKHLSQILNEKLHQNFNKFINKYRVEEAKRKILDPKEKDFVLLKIAFDVGFNSKSAFNAAFKKFAKMSPSQYRRVGEQKSEDIKVLNQPPKK
ncbi:MAG: helix-turn-helix domain-containing protein [Candidatus Aminicenantes bacterium]|nr:helix-turn-helix domain-containing protein [Candidatus Aminicenantes bacterium]